jgi:hypothetical protein
MLVGLLLDLVLHGFVAQRLELFWLESVFSK